MHRCLEIQELLDNIFEHTDTPKTLLNSALTCRQFSETALPALWGSHGGFKHVLNLLPSDCRFVIHSQYWDEIV
jgi:hypothetical protein